MPYAYTLTWYPATTSDEEKSVVTLETDDVAPGEFWSEWDGALESVALASTVPPCPVSTYVVPRDVFLATADLLCSSDSGFRRLADHLRGNESHSFYGTDGPTGWTLR